MEKLGDPETDIILVNSNYLPLKDPKMPSLEIFVGKINACENLGHLDQRDRPPIFSTKNAARRNLEKGARESEQSNYCY